VRTAPARSGWLQIATVFGGFLLGPFSALRVSLRLVPESDLVQTVSVFAFALVFVGGTLLWMGLGIAAVVFGALLSLLRGRLPGATVARSERLVPPGYGAYVGLGAVIGAAVGLLAGLATGLTVLWALGVWTVLGLAYGLVLWMAARHGYLPFPEPE
jgi:hypothetical protein